MDKEQQIEESVETKSSDEEIRRLKRMVLTFKRKYQLARKDIAKQEEALPHDAAEIVKKCQELEEECDSLVKQQQILKQIIEKNKQEIGCIKEENAALQEQQEILKNFLSQKEQEKNRQPPQETEVFHSRLEEKEVELRTAQQHLAKKMKEIVELKEYIRQQEESLKSYQEQIHRENVEFLAREKEFREEIKQWEGKYLEIHQQWQDAADNIRSLKQLEEKYLKMQEYIKNLGSIIEGTPPPSKKSQTKASDDELDLFNLDTYKNKKNDHSRD